MLGTGGAESDFRDRRGGAGARQPVHPLHDLVLQTIKDSIGGFWTFRCLLNSLNVPKTSFQVRLPPPVPQHEREYQHEHSICVGKAGYNFTIGSANFTIGSAHFHRRVFGCQSLFSWTLRRSWTRKMTTRLLLWQGTWDVYVQDPGWFLSGGEILHSVKS